MKSKLDELTLESGVTPEQAYCLGGIISSAECYVSGQTTRWISLVRHNPVSDDETPQFMDNIAKHKKCVQKISKSLSGRELKADSPVYKNYFRRKVGFAFYFTSRKFVNFESLLQFTEQLIDASDDRVKRAFLVGVFDGRGYFDSHNKLFDVDCERTDGTRLILKYLQVFNCGINPSRARPPARPRDPQLRIHKSSLPQFMKTIGLISPIKIGIIKSNSNSSCIINSADDVLPGLQVIEGGLSFETQKIKIPADEIIQAEQDEEILLQKHILSRARNKKKAEPYARIPRAKKTLEDRTGGRKIYPRDVEVSLNALRLAEYKCECDRTHETFIRRKDETPYTEPHHLVPLCCHASFDVSLDVEENIVSLCSHCHNKLHYGRDIGETLQTLYDARKDLLASAGIDISFSELLRIYKKQPI